MPVVHSRISILLKINGERQEMNPIFYGDSSKPFWRLVWILPGCLFDIAYSLGVKLQNIEWKIRHR